MNPKQKCPRGSIVFVFIEDLNFGHNDDFTYFSSTALNSNNEPEETFRFDRKTDIRMKWIQDWLHNPKTIVSAINENTIVRFKLLYHIIYMV